MSETETSWNFNIFRSTNKHTVPAGTWKGDSINVVFTHPLLTPPTQFLRDAIWRFGLS